MTPKQIPMKTEETPRRIRLDLMCQAELAIYNASQEIEKMDADVRLTKAQTLLSEARGLVADFIDKVEINQPEKEKKLFLLEYHLSRRSDEGWGHLALIEAESFQSAKEKLIAAKTHDWSDALSHGTLSPDHIKCLNLES